MVQFDEDRIAWPQRRQGLRSMSKVEVEVFFLLLPCILAPDSFQVGHRGSRFFSSVGSVVFIFLPISSSAGLFPVEVQSVER